MSLISKLCRVLPKPVIKRVIFYISKNAYEKLHKHLPNPRVFLKEENLKNCIFLPNRTSLLKHLPSYAVVAEIGVFEGDFSKEIINSCTPKKLYLFDNWSSIKRHQFIENKFQKEIETGQVEIENSSFENLENIKNESLDWVYLDTESCYSQMTKELEILSAKIKRDGYICGNKYIIGKWKEWIKYDTIEAVNGFCIRNSYELIYFVHSPNTRYSFALRKL